MDGRDAPTPLSRPEASAAVERLGWRLLLSTLSRSVPVESLAGACAVAEGATRAAGPDADGHLRVDLRPDRVELSLQTRHLGAVTEVDVRLADAITAALEHDPARSPVPSGSPQLLEIAIDTRDASAIRPFWKAVLGYVDELVPDGPGEGLVDPAGRMPTIWFQHMDEPRPLRNRIHFDVTVPHDQANRRVQQALAGGGRLLSDAQARAFWVLADSEGNEVCVCTWQDRD